MDMEKTCSTCKYVNVETWHNDKVWYCNGQKNTPLVYPNDTCDDWSPEAKRYDPGTTENLPTNAERIRAMTDDELAEFLNEDLCETICDYHSYSPECDSQCVKHIFDWLKKREEPEEPALKHCPFCGGEAFVTQIPYNTTMEFYEHPKWTWKNPGMWIVGCETEMCLGNYNNVSICFLSKERAIEAWNRRAADD